MLLRVGPAKACEIGHKVASTLVAEEKRKRGHDGCAAYLRRVIEMGLEPEGGTTHAHLREVGPLPAIADERRMLQADFLNAFDGPPHKDVRGVGAHILRMATDAALGDINLASALDL